MDASKKQLHMTKIASGTSTYLTPSRLIAAFMQQAVAIT
jgi:hypothetical protein